MNRVAHQCLSCLWIPAKSLRSSITNILKSITVKRCSAESISRFRNIVGKHRRTGPSTLSRVTPRRSQGCVSDQVCVLHISSPCILCPALPYRGLLEAWRNLCEVGSPRAAEGASFSLGHDPWCFRTSRGKPTQGALHQRSPS